MSFKKRGLGRMKYIYHNLKKENQETEAPKISSFECVWIPVTMVHSFHASAHMNLLGFLHVSLPSCLFPANVLLSSSLHTLKSQNYNARYSYLRVNVLDSMELVGKMQIRQNDHPYGENRIILFFC